MALTVGPIAPAQDRPQFSSESELVVLHVMATDRSGSYVSGLTVDAFRVLDENRPQSPRFFLSEDAPVTVGLLIDSSGSMRLVGDRVIAAAAEFVASSNSQDEVFALVFNDDVQAVLGEPAFTSDAEVLRHALASAFQPAGRTALYDAVSLGLAYVANGTRARRVLVVLSDGGDNASHVRLNDVLREVQSSNTMIYSVVLADPADSDAHPKGLRQLAETSGGESFSPRDIANVRRVFQQIARDVRRGYTIGYAPMNTSERPGFHHVRVDVTTPDGRRLRVRSRTGYLREHGNARTDR